MEENTQRPEDEEWMQSVRPKREIIYETGTLCFMKRDYTMFQNVLLTRIMTCLQDNFKYYLEHQQHHENVSFSEKTNLLGKMTIDIPMRKLEPRSSHFPRIRQHLEEMSRKPVELPYVIDRVKYYYRAPRLFSFQYVKVAYKTPVARLTFSREVLRYMVCMDMGYHKLDVTALKQLRLFSSRRIYHILQCWVKKGYCDYDARFLIDQLTERNGAYVSFCNVRDKILNSAQIEMKEAYRKGILDEYFTYSTFPKDTGTKWPDRISLMVHLRNDEAPLDKDGNPALSVEAIRVKLMLTTEWGVEEKVAQDVVKFMKRWQMPEVENCLHEVRRKIREKEHTASAIANKAGYALRAVEKIVKG